MKKKKGVWKMMNKKNEEMNRQILGIERWG